MTPDRVSGWERLAGVTSAIAVLAWLGTLSMWTAQLFSWLIGARVPHPSVVGLARTVARWFGITHHTWADSPYEGITLYTALKHAYVTSTCLVVAGLFSVISVLLIIHDDRARAEPVPADLLPDAVHPPPERDGEAV